MTTQPPGDSRATQAALLAEIETSRQEQANLQNSTVAGFLLLWALLEAESGSGRLGDIKRWFEVLDELAAAYGSAARLQSAGAYERIRALSGAGGRPLRYPPIGVDRQALAGSMRALVIRPLARTRTAREIAAAQQAASQAFTRHVLQPARTLVAGTANRAPGFPTDQRVIGWARVTDGDPCAWCAMLASRIVPNSGGQRSLYTSKRAALVTESGTRYHDGCSCTAVPVYRKDAISELSRWFREVWNESTEGHSGQDAQNAFRRTMEAQRREHGTLTAAHEAQRQVRDVP